MLDAVSTFSAASSKVTVEERDGIVSVTCTGGQPLTVAPELQNRVISRVVFTPDESAECALLYYSIYNMLFAQ